MELTFSTGIVCPNCGNASEYITKGLFGGSGQQMFINWLLERVKREQVKTSLWKRFWR